MSPQESERLARLEQRVADLARQLEINTKDTKKILETLNNLTGGKQALMWLTGVAVSIGLLIVAIHNKVIR